MSSFFIEHPTIAIVISIVMILLGGLSLELGRLHDSFHYDGAVLREGGVRHLSLIHI